MSDLDKVLTIISETFGIDKATIKDEMTPDIIEKWDSVTHMDLLTKFESAFNINFEMEEISEMISIEMIKKVLKKHGVNI
jgi:acyl carrier protein